MAMFKTCVYTLLLCCLALSSCGGVRGDAAVESTAEGTVITFSGGPVAKVFVELSNYDDRPGQDIWGIECSDAPCIESPLEIGVVPPGAIEDKPMTGPLESGEYIVWMWSYYDQDSGPPAAFHFSLDLEREPHPVQVLLEALLSTSNPGRE